VRYNKKSWHCQFREPQNYRIFLSWKGLTGSLSPSPGSTQDHPTSNPISESSVQMLLEICAWGHAHYPVQPAPCPLPSGGEAFPNPHLLLPDTAPCHSLRSCCWSLWRRDYPPPFHHLHTRCLAKISATFLGKVGQEHPSSSVLWLFAGTMVAQTPLLYCTCCPRMPAGALQLTGCTGGTYQCLSLHVRKWRRSVYTTLV